MRYVDFEEKISRPKRIVLLGWPSDIPLTCPSGLLRNEVKTLIGLATSDPPVIRFKKLSNAQYVHYLENGKELNELEDDGLSAEGFGGIGEKRRPDDDRSNTLSKRKRVSEGRSGSRMHEEGNENFSPAPQDIQAVSHIEPSERDIISSAVVPYDQSSISSTATHSFAPNHSLHLSESGQSSQLSPMSRVLEGRFDDSMFSSSLHPSFRPLFGSTPGDALDIGSFGQLPPNMDREVNVYDFNVPKSPCNLEILT